MYGFRLAACIHILIVFLFHLLKCHDVTRFTVLLRIADVEIVVKDLPLIVGVLQSLRYMTIDCSSRFVAQAAQQCRRRGRGVASDSRSL